ncbi:MAG: hypothetical protein V4617_15010 [Gemmatimonadota bacterium]
MVHLPSVAPSEAALGLVVIEVPLQALLMQRARLVRRGWCGVDRGTALAVARRLAARFAALALVALELAQRADVWRDGGDVGLMHELLAPGGDETRGDQLSAHPLSG